MVNQRSPSHKSPQNAPYLLYKRFFYLTSNFLTTNDSKQRKLEQTGFVVNRSKSEGEREWKEEERRSERMHPTFNALYYLSRYDYILKFSRYVPSNRTIHSDYLKKEKHAKRRHGGNDLFCSKTVYKAVDRGKRS